MVWFVVVAVAYEIQNKNTIRFTKVFIYLSSTHFPIYPSFIYLSTPTQMVCIMIHNGKNVFLSNSFSQQNNLEVDMLSILFMLKRQVLFVGDLPPSCKIEPPLSLCHEY